MRILALFSVLAGMACKDDRPTPRTGPVYELRPTVRIGDRYEVSLLVRQFVGEEAEPSLTSRMRYEDEILEAARGRPGAIRRHWGGETTTMRRTSGKWEPRIEYYMQFEALLPRGEVAVGDRWRRHSPLGPFSLRPGRPFDLVRKSSARCTLASVEGTTARVEADLEMILLEGTAFSLHAVLTFDLERHVLTKVTLRRDELVVFEGTRTLRRAP